MNLSIFDVIHLVLLEETGLRFGLDCHPQYTGQLEASINALIQLLSPTGWSV